MYVCVCMYTCAMFGDVFIQQRTQPHNALLQLYLVFYEIPQYTAPGNFHIRPIAKNECLCKHYVCVCVCLYIHTYALVCVVY